MFLAVCVIKSLEICVKQDYFSVTLEKNFFKKNFLLSVYCSNINLRNLTWGSMLLAPELL